MRRSLLQTLAAILVLSAIGYGVHYAYAHVRITTDLNWSEDIQPIFRAQCMECHSPHGNAPNYVDLTTYGNEPGQSGARDWAKAIEEEIMVGHMPPWLPDDRFEQFSNERTLTDEEREYILAWIQGGSPQGPIRNQPTPEEFLTRDWEFGQPDYVVEMPEAVEIPAEPNDFYVSMKIPVELEEDQWVSAYEFWPGTPTLVHSITALVHGPKGAEPETLEVEIKKPYDPLADEDELEEIGERTTPPGPHFLGRWVAGSEPVLLPDEAGVRLRDGSTIELQVVYRKQTYEDRDKAFEDRSKLGLFFAREDVDLIVEGRMIENADFTIPKGAEKFEAKAEITLEEDAHLLSLHPELGWLGETVRMTAYYPDGLQKTLLNIPKWNQKYASPYIFERPVRAPAGTRIELAGTYNNSEQNYTNPYYPPREMPAGRGDGTESLRAWVQYSLDDHLYIPTPTPTPKPVDVAESGMFSIDFGGEADRKKAEAKDQGSGQFQGGMEALAAAFVEEDERERADGAERSEVEAVRKDVFAEEIAAFANDAAEREENAAAGGSDKKQVAVVTAGRTAAAQAEKAEAEKAEAEEEEIYWCPMRGTGEGQCGLEDFHEPGNCPVCGMNLRPKSWFMKRYEGQLAQEDYSFPLKAEGVQDVYWCPNRGQDDHERIDYTVPGNCPVDGEQLLHKSRFEDVKTWVCITEECPDKEKVYYSPGLCPTCAQPVQSMGHMDHNPVHGGQLIMADNLYHHLEGTLPEEDEFRLYFYDDWKKPVDPRNFSGKVIIEWFDEEADELIEEEVPLEYDAEGDEFLTASIDPVKEFPVDFSAMVNLAGEESLFSFAFDDLTKDEATGDVQMRLHAHTERLPVQIPETARGIAAEIFRRNAIIEARIAAEDWFGLHNPAFDAKELAEALERDPAKGMETSLNVRDRGKLYKAVDRITQGAIFLDRAGDTEDEPRVHKAYGTFSEGIGLLAEIYPEAAEDARESPEPLPPAAGPSMAEPVAGGR